MWGAPLQIEDLYGNVMCGRATGSSVTLAPYTLRISSRILQRGPVAHICNVWGVAVWAKSPPALQIFDLYPLREPGPLWRLG